MNFNLTGYEKFVDMHLPFFEFWYTVKEEFPALTEKIVKNNPFFPLLMCVGLDFLYTLHKQHMAAD